MKRHGPATLLLVLGVALAARPWTLYAQDPSEKTAPGDPLPPYARLQLGSKLFRHPGNVAEMAVSPDEQTIVTAGDDLIVWDAATGQQRWQRSLVQQAEMLPAASYGMRALAFTPAGRHIVMPISGPSERPNSRAVIVRYEIDAAPSSRVTQISVGMENDRGRPAQRIAVNQTARSIDVSPDGQKYALGSGQGLIVCDGEGGVLFSVPNAAAPIDVDEMNDDRLAFGGPYTLARFSPDGRRLAVVTSDDSKSIKLVDAESGEIVRTVTLSDKLVRMAFSPDGDRLVATERDSAVRVYDLATGDRVWETVLKLTNPFENYTSAVAWSPDGRQIAVGATDNLLHLFDAVTGQEQAALEGHQWYPWGVAYSADSQRLYSSGWDGAIRRWDLKTGQQLPLPGDAVRATGVSTLSPDGRLIAYEDESGAVHLVDAATGEAAGLLQLPGADFSQLRFSPDGSQLAGGGDLGGDVLAVVWDLHSGKLVQQWRWPKGRDPHSEVEALAFTPDGARLAAAVFRQSQAVLWELAAGREIARLPHRNIYGLAFTADGQSLATVGWDSTLRFWHAVDGRPNLDISVEKHATVPGGDLRMYAVAFSPDGRLMATAHMDGSVWIWDVEPLARRRRIAPQGSFAYGALDFSPDSLYAAAGVSSGALGVWDAYSGERVWQPGSHGDHVYTVCFGRRSDVLLTGGDDGLCYLWQLNPEDHRPQRDAAQLWTELAGTSSRGAFRAQADLAASPGAGVPLIAEQLRSIVTLIDLARDDPAVGDGEARRRRRLQQLLTDKDPTIERRDVAQRALAVLAVAGTPEARTLLEELAATSACDELRAHAALALLRAERDDLPRDAP